MNHGFLQTVVAPIVAKMGPIDEVLRMLEHYVAVELTEGGLSPDEVAAHLGMSKTWVYEVLRRKGQPRSNTGVQLSVLSLLAARHPEAMSLRAVATEIGGPDERILNCLEALRKIGKVTVKKGRYKAVDKEMVLSNNPAKVDRVEHCAKLSYDLGLDYLVGGNVLYVRLKYVLSRAAWTKAKERLGQALVTVLHEAKTNSYQENPDGMGDDLTIQGVLALGPEKGD